MRVYVPATSTTAQALIEDRVLGPAPLTAFAVTPGLREWYVDDDEEALEYAAFSAAARGSLRLIDADDGAARTRIVISADVSAADVEVRDDLDRGVVEITAPVSLDRVACAHIDDDAARPTVTAAAAAVIAADLGSEQAQEAVDDAEGHELSWYARQEIAAALALSAS